MRRYSPSIIRLALLLDCTLSKSNKLAVALMVAHSQIDILVVRPGHTARREELLLSCIWEVFLASKLYYFLFTLGIQIVWHEEAVGLERMVCSCVGISASVRRQN